MFSLRTLACSLALGALLAGPSLAQPVTLKVASGSLEEGRAGVLTLTVAANSRRPVLLLSCQAEVWQGERQVASAGGDLRRVVHGISLETPGEDPLLGGDAGDDERDQVVTLTLRAIDDPGPAARLPLPDRVSTALGEEHIELPLLSRRTQEVALRPRSGGLTLRVRWEAIPVPVEIPSGIYELGSERRWVPEAGQREEAAPSGPRTLLRMTTRHWRRWRGELRGELLLTKPAFAALPIYRGSLTQELEVTPAAFGYEAARAQAGLGRETEGWRLADDRWLLQTRSSWALVEAGRPAVSGLGSSSYLAEQISSGQAASLSWELPSQASHLEVALKEMFEAQTAHSKGGRRVLSWRVDASSLRPFLDLVRESGLELAGDRLRQPLAR